MWDNEGKRWHMSTSNAMNTAREEIFKRDMLTCIECKTPGPIKLAVHTHSEKVECLENPILEHFITLCAFCWRRLYVKDGEAEMTEVPPVIVTRQVISQRNRLFRKSIYVRMQCQECKQPLGGRVLISPQMGGLPEMLFHEDCYAENYDWETNTRKPGTTEEEFQQVFKEWDEFFTTHPLPDAEQRST